MLKLETESEMLQKALQSVQHTFNLHWYFSKQTYAVSSLDTILSSAIIGLTVMNIIKTLCYFK